MFLLLELGAECEKGRCKLQEGGCFFGEFFCWGEVSRKSWGASDKNVNTQPLLAHAPHYILIALFQCSQLIFYSYCSLALVNGRPLITDIWPLLGGLVCALRSHWLQFWGPMREAPAISPGGQGPDSEAPAPRRPGGILREGFAWYPNASGMHTSIPFPGL